MQVCLPFVAEIFRDKTSMAVVRLGFAAEQARVCQPIWFQASLDFPLAHEVDEAFFIRLPLAALLFVIVEEVLGRGQARLIGVGDGGDCLEKVL